MKNSTSLNRISRFVLFGTSYLPLAFLVFLKQLFENSNYLHWGGWTIESIKIFITKFGFSLAMLTICLLSFIGHLILMQNLRKDLDDNGDIVTISNISNKNSESIGYIATYILPFIFQNYSTLYEIISFAVLIMIIYHIYVNSSMIVINPILNCKYSILDIDYLNQNGKQKNGLMIVKKEDLIDEEHKIKIYPIGFKLYIAKKYKHDTI